MTLATIVDGFLIYKVFDSPCLRNQPVPSGIATSETILALANRGKRSLLLFVGMGAGVAGKAIGIPMDLFGVSWFGNVIAMMAFASAALPRGSLIPMWTAAVSMDGVVPTMITYLPHGMMVGAGMVSLVQAALVLGKKEQEEQKSWPLRMRPASAPLPWKACASPSALASCCSSALRSCWRSPPVSTQTWALVSSWSGSSLQPSLPSLLSSFAACLQCTPAGSPAMATALIFLMVGIMMGFPQWRLAFWLRTPLPPALHSPTWQTDLKCGWILRGRGANPEFEKAGRKQQFISELLGYCVAFVMVLLLANTYFDQGLFVPTTKTFIATIDAGANIEVAKWLLIWAIPGAVLQILGGHPSARHSCLPPAC